MLCDGESTSHIDLRAVTFVDAASEELLSGLYQQGADLLSIDC